MTTDERFPMQEQRRKRAEELVCAILRRDDPEQNQCLIELLRTDMEAKMWKFTMFGWDGQGYEYQFLHLTLEDFIKRHLRLMTDPQERKLSCLYQYQPGEGSSFYDELMEQLSRQDGLYEPHATWLVEKIQSGQNEKENRERLVAMIYPLIAKTLNLCVYSRGCNHTEMDDLLPYLVELLLCVDHSGYAGLNNVVEQTWIYKYDRTLMPTFCSYLRAHLLKYAETWNRRNRRDGMVQVRGEMKGEGIYRPGLDKSILSLDQMEQDREGNSYETSGSALAGSMKQAQELQWQEYQKEEQELKEMEMNILSLLFQELFQSVDALDEDRPGPRSVTERSLLSYHLKKSAAYWKEIWMRETPEEEGARRVRRKTEYYNSLTREGYPVSLGKAAERLWDHPMKQVVAIQNQWYQDIFMRDYNYLKHLALRVCKSGIEAEPYLESERDVRNKVSGWARTVEHRVERLFGMSLEEYAAEEYAKRREVIFYDIQ